MTNRVKIIINLVVIIIVGIGIFLGIKINKQYLETSSRNQGNQYFNVIIENEQQNKTDENVTNDILQNVQETNTTKNETNDYIGKEEQGSSNIKMTNEEKAISLAKKAWGSTENYYNFEATQDSTNSNKYIVRVRSKSTTQEVTRYYVDIKTETVTE